MTVSQERRGLLFILVGPGGVGKNALLNECVEQIAGLRQLPTATTRPKRSNEKQGREHLFVSHDEFQHMIHDQALLEYQEVHPGHFYGVPRATVEDAIIEGQDLIADIEVFGTTAIRSAYPDNSIAIFIAPPSVEALVERLQKRGASTDDIDDRLRRLPIEMRYAPLCDYVIVNDDVRTAAAQLCAIIQKERGTSVSHASDLMMDVVSYQVSVLPMFRDEVLCSSDPEPAFLSAPLVQGEDPADVALRIIADKLNITAGPDRLDYAAPDSELPVVIDYVRQQQSYQLAYSYIYHLPERITAPLGWSWVTHDNMNLTESYEGGR